MSERVLATVLFTDIVGSTERAAALGDRRWRELKAQHHALVRREIARYDGSEVDIASEGFLITFDRPLLAIRCACAVRDGVRSLGLEIRVGLHAGEVEREAGTVTGIAVHIGARVAARADAGEVVVSGTVRDLVAGAGLQFADRGVQTLKGVPGEWRLFAVLDAGPEERESAGSSPDGRTGRTSFVGRQQELAILLRCLDLAGRGQGQLVLVAGEPGIGKTRLMSEFAEHAQAEGWSVLVGHAYDSEGMPPYLPFSEALRDYVRAASLADLRAQLDEAGPEVALLAPDIHRRLPDLPASPPASPEEQRYRLFESICDFLLGIPGHSEARGLVLILDDLHWADPSSLLLFQHLARRVSRAPMLLAGAYRGEAVSRGHPLAAVLADLRRESPGERLALAPLPSAAIEALVRGMAGIAPAEAVLHAVEQQTEGNPFFVGEVVHDLLANHRDLTAPSTAMEAAGLPEGVREVIERRLGRLSATANDLLRLAAIVGDGCSFDELLAMAGDESPRLLDALDESIAAGLLGETDDGYHFSHALIRQTVHDGLTLARRQRLHLRAAEALERVHTGNLGPHVAALAMHYRLAGGQEEKALAYAEGAAERALASYAYAEATRHLEQALELQEALDPDDRAKRCDLLLALAGALLPAGEPERVFETVAPQALAMAEALEDSDRASRTCQAALDGLQRYGSVTMSGTAVYRRWAEQADRYAADGTLARVNADLELARACEGDGRLAQVLPLRERALALARQLGDRDTFFFAAMLYVVSLWHLPAGQVSSESILRVTDELSRYSREGVRARRLGEALYYSGVVYLNLGDRARAEAIWHELAELAQRTRDTDLLLLSLTNEIDGAFLDGELETAVAAATHVGSRADELGAPVTGQQYAARGFRPLMYLNRAEKALEVLPGDTRLAGLATEQGYTAWFTRSRRVLVLACLGRSDEARAAMNQLLAEQAVIAEEHVLTPLAGVILLETAVLLNDREAAALLASRLRPAAPLAYGGLAYTCVARHLGAASALLGERETARAYYEQALEVAGRARFRPELALTHLEIAELLLDEAVSYQPSAISSTRGGPGGGSVGASVSGGPLPAPSHTQRDEALQHLEFAIPELRDMHMQPALERALQLLERSQALPPSPVTAPPAYPDRLSEREVEVLRLLAAGRSNPEIAAELVISLNTVARHVNHIFAKIGAANRVEAATYAHRQGLA